MNNPMLLCPVDALDTALPFFQQALGLPLRLRDGERYAALDLGGITLALLAGEERLLEQTALSMRVDDLDATIARLSAAGAALEQAPQNGPHERRAVLRAPGGLPLVLSMRLPRIGAVS